MAMRYSRDAIQAGYIWLHWLHIPDPCSLSLIYLVLLAPLATVAGEANVARTHLMPVTQLDLIPPRMAAVRRDQ